MSQTLFRCGKWLYYRIEIYIFGSVHCEFCTKRDHLWPTRTKVVCGEREQWWPHVVSPSSDKKTYYHLALRWQPKKVCLLLFFAYILKLQISFIKPNIVFISLISFYCLYDLLCCVNLQKEYFCLDHHIRVDALNDPLDKVASNNGFSGGILPNKKTRLSCAQVSSVPNRLDPIAGAKYQNYNAFMISYPEMKWILELLV